ncbi:sensor histidine kinase [Eubacterium sp. 1001713B170207_170306_E7]|uniref:sensor histidine kinase n=1 Tax=Eubacterium sp. 1001713B170207_170306_E7 TaxID=2787097 RepID=UPI001896C6F5|nr:sensor histidine kinase [Eubacterium sp. 1001713B170207_170306_E7]
MKKKFNAITLGLIILIISAALCLALIQWLYRVDNKYTQTTPQAENGVLTLTADTLSKDKLLCLVDGWAFFQGKHLNPVDFATDGSEQPEPAEYVYIGQYPDFSMGGREHSPYGTGAYHLKIINEGQPAVLSIAFQEIFSSADIWINGELVESLGVTDPQAYKPYIKNTVVSFEAGAETDILINTANFSHYYSGIYYPPILGEASEISHLIFMNQLFYAFLCIASLVIALFTLVVWMSPKRDRLFFYYGLMTLAFGLHVAYQPLRWIGVPLTGSLYALEDCAYYVMLLCVVAISSIISQVSRKSIYRAFILPLSATLCVVSVVVPLLVLPGAPWLVSAYGGFLDFYQLLVFVYLMAAAVLALKQREVKAYFLMAANAVFGISLLVQITSSNAFEPIYTGWQSEYCGFILVLIFGGMMVFYYRQVLNENKRLTAHLEEEVAARTRELTTLMNERKKFLSDLAHDLKAPVSAIQGFIELVKYGNVQVDDEIQRYLEVINQKSNEVQTKVRSLQEFTSQDEAVMKKEKMDLGRLLDDFYENNWPDAEANGVGFSVIKPGKPIEMMGNRELIYRVFENLFYNAMSFTPMNGRIVVELTLEQGWAVIRFSDNGAGIPPDILPKIFDRFFTTRGEGSGSQGLGLFIVRYTIKAHGGTIDAVSEMGEGTVFTIRLKTL